MTPRRKKRLLILLGTLLFLLALGFGAYPYLAVTAPVGANAVAVEGWIPDAMMPAVKAEIDQRGYSTVYTTGTIRPFSYYLKNGEAIDVVLSAPVRGEVRMNVSGIGGAGFMLIAGSDTLINQKVTGEPHRYSTHLPQAVDHLRLVSFNTSLPPAELDNIFVKYLRISWINVHEISRSIEFVRVDSTRSPAWPTYAHASAAYLERLGIGSEKIIIAPATDPTVSRTLANAQGFALRAKEQGLNKVDVLSLGVHARRSRKMYRKACGGTMEVGVIALRDPEAPPGEWWKSVRGWFKVAKELAGVPVSSLFDAEDVASEP